VSIAYAKWSNSLDTTLTQTTSATPGVNECRGALVFLSAFSKNYEYEQKQRHKVPSLENIARWVVDSSKHHRFRYRSGTDMSPSLNTSIWPTLGKWIAYTERGGRHMPYLRVRSQALPIDQKRVMAQKLIEITLHAFHLRAEERNQITIQFISQAPADGNDLKDADFTLEVIGHDLTEEKKAAFTEETTGMISHLMPHKPRGLIARLLRAKADTHGQISLQFQELSPAISDPFVVTHSAAA
jgi:hypothetical protein